MAMIVRHHLLVLCTLLGFCFSDDLDDCRPKCTDSLSMTDGICNCDQECIEYADCCGDKVNSTKLSPKIKDISRELWECVTVSDIFSKYMVVRCPKNHNYNSLCTKNIKPGQNFHHTLDIPIYDARKNVYFGNLFCALCNGVKQEDLVPLKMEMECSKENMTANEMKEKGVYDRNKKQWRVGVEKCQLKYGLQKNNQGRNCFDGISACPTKTETRLAQKCLSYSFPVEGNGEKKYKNPECAACHGARNLTCYSPGLVNRIGPTSYAILLDISWKLDSCEVPQSVWDPLSRKCVELDPSGTLKEPETTTLLSFLNYLSALCLILSVIGLVLHLVKHYSLATKYHWHTLPRNLTNSLAWSLLVFQLLFLLGVKQNTSGPLCIATASALHFLCLSVVFWMNCVSFEIWRTFSRFRIRQTSMSNYWKYALYGWGAPFLIAALTLVFEGVLPDSLSPLFGKSAGICWFANRTALALYLFLPTCIVILVNIAFFLLTVKWLHKKINDKTLAKSASGREEHKRFWVYLKFFSIMGLSWVSAIIATFTNHPAFWIPFIVFTGLQGVFIFVMVDYKISLSFYTCGRFDGKTKSKTQDDSSVPTSSTNPSN